MAKQDLNEQTAIDMANARKAMSVSVENLRDFLYNGRDEWEKKQKVLSVLEKDPVFDKSQREYATKTECYERGVSMLNRLSELQLIHGWDEHETFVLALSSIDETLPVRPHKVAFQTIFMSQGGPTLINKYGRLVSTLGIIGCYLQTELGHGSNVAGLETTATYIPETKEFELHSPTFTSRKWWIGGLGKTATHGVVQAKLILPSGEDMGPHLFFMQLRSLDDHKVLPGIHIGDIGPKVMGGHASTDHGFALFNRVRIPKDHMLSGFAQIADDGQYLQPPHKKIGYAGMLYIRSIIVTSAGWVIARAATVAIRYATVRRQGEVGPDGMEKQVITYPSVYGRLLPILSRAYVFIQLGRILVPAFKKMAGSFGNGDMSQLPELHLTTSGLKAYVSATTVNDIEGARRSMGGHGYSAFSGLGRLYADYLPAVSYEGDNFVLDQQVVRASLKAYRNLFSSTPASIQPLSPFFSHLRHLVDPSPTSSIPRYEWRTPGTSIYLLELRAALVVQNYARDSSTPDSAVNQRVANAVTEAFVATQVGNMTQDLEKLGDDGLIVEKLLLLYLLTTVERGLSDMLLFGLIPPMAPGGSGSSDAVISLRQTINLISIELVPQTIGLVDAFGFTDWELASALGVYNGRVYESLWERAVAEPLNRTEVPDAYEKSIRPVLQRGRTLLTKFKL